MKLQKKSEYQYFTLMGQEDKEKMKELITIRLTTALMSQVETERRKRRLSLSEYIREICRESLSSRDK